VPAKSRRPHGQGRQSRGGGYGGESAPSISRRTGRGLWRCHHSARSFRHARPSRLLLQSAGLRVVQRFPHRPVCREAGAAGSHAWHHDRPGPQFTPRPLPRAAGSVRRELCSRAPHPACRRRHLHERRPRLDRRN